MATQTKTKQVRKTAGLKFIKRGGRVNTYADILADIAVLKPGESLVLTPRQGESPTQYMNRLNSAMYRNPPKCRRGYGFFKQTTEDGKVAVSLAKLA